MARRVVVSEPTGETFIFDDDWNEPDGRVRQIEYEAAPHSRVPAHAHPNTTQFFEVISGELCVRTGGQTTRLKAGERAATKPGEVHAQWNEGDEPARVVERYEPPLAIEPFFTAVPIAIGSKNPLKIAVLFSDFKAISVPGTTGMRIFIAVFGALGRMVGLSGWYKPLLAEATLPQSAPAQAS